MSEITTLTIKIPAELKELIKNAAADAQHSLSAEVWARLEKSFATHDEKSVDDKKGKKVVKAEEPEIEVDNQHLGEHTEPALTQKELKKLRQLLSKAPNKKK